MIHYYSTDDQIVCETSKFPTPGDYLPTLFINGRKVGDNYGKSCQTCRIRAFDHFAPTIKESFFILFEDTELSKLLDQVKLAQLAQGLNPVVSSRLKMKPSR